jgi:hypothetical protein
MMILMEVGILGSGLTFEAGGVGSHGKIVELSDIILE